MKYNFNDQENFQKLFIEIQKLKMENKIPKSDIFLITDLMENIKNKTSVEFLNNKTGTYKIAFLKNVNIDIQEKIIIYQFIFEDDTSLEIASDLIEYNNNNPKKYYFHLNNEINYRIQL